MTFEQFRAFGFVSKLKYLVAKGPSDQLVNAVTADTTAQTNLATEEAAAGTANQAEALKLEQPLITKESALASGDRSAALSAAMPTISTISQGYEGAKTSIFNSLPAGAARDKALADLEVQKATGIAGTEAGMVENAPATLASVGQGMGAMSLQQLGAALSGYSGSTASASTGAQMQTAQSQAKWQPIVSLASAAGGAAGGIFEGKG